MLGIKKLKTWQSVGRYEWYYSTTIIIVLISVLLCRCFEGHKTEAGGPVWHPRRESLRGIWGRLARLLEALALLLRSPWIPGRPIFRMLFYKEKTGPVLTYCWAICLSIPWLWPNWLCFVTEKAKFTTCAQGGKFCRINLQMYRIWVGKLFIQLCH